jgi:hypothetical protein
MNKIVALKATVLLVTVPVGLDRNQFPRALRVPERPSLLLPTSDLVPNDRLLTKIAASGVDSRVVAWIREFVLGRTQSQSRRATIGGSQSNVRSTERKWAGPTTVPSLRK